LNKALNSDQARLASLIQAAAGGDRAAFQTLYEQTSAKLFGVALRILRDRAAAEEALQEAYLKVWQNAERFSSGYGTPVAWLCAIARNTAIDRARSERMPRSADGSDAELLERMASVDSVDVVARESLRTCLGELDDEARRCVVLAYCEGLSREELAERFARPVGTIKTWLHRSLKILSRCLEN
jgi:RNA polymerase sigma-70 factor (ECF subfamily)